MRGFLTGFCENELMCLEWHSFFHLFKWWSSPSLLVLCIPPPQAGLPLSPGYYSWLPGIFSLGKKWLLCKMASMALYPMEVLPFLNPAFFKRHLQKLQIFPNPELTNLTSREGWNSYFICRILCGWQNLTKTYHWPEENVNCFPVGWAYSYLQNEHYISSMTASLFTRISKIKTQSVLSHNLMAGCEKSLRHNCNLWNIFPFAQPFTAVLLNYHQVHFTKLAKDEFPDIVKKSERELVDWVK